MATREVYNGGQLVAVEVIPDPPAPLLYPVDIVQLFSPAELLQLEQSNSLAIVAFRTQFFAAVNPIALDDARFVAAVGVMRSHSILTETRAAEVLAGVNPNA